jgi:alpha-beta hydrolase superfamily lysophospholipase
MGRSLATALVAGLLVGGCGGEPEQRAAAPARTATASPTPSPAPRGRPLRFSAADGVKLRGTLVPGRGRRAPAVVLVHQSDGGPAQFADFVPYLHAAGYAALTYTSRTGPGRLDETRNARDVAGAVLALRHQRAIDPTRIAAVGASIGASSVAYLAFTRLGRSLPAIVGLSPADFADDPPKGRHPHDVLLIADRAERSAAEFIAHGSPGIEVRTSPVNGHGVALLPDDQVRGWVLSWLAQRLEP